ncbi:hypothetical protein EES38_22240, partial [Vibrio viridaestus]
GLPRLAGQAPHGARSSRREEGCLEPTFAQAGARAAGCEKRGGRARSLVPGDVCLAGWMCIGLPRLAGQAPHGARSSRREEGCLEPTFAQAGARAAGCEKRGGRARSLVP